MSRIESRIAGAEVQFRMRCNKCGRIGIWHRDLDIAERTAHLHESHAHAGRKAA